MENGTSGFTRLFAVLLMVVFAAVTFITGCRLMGGGNDSDYSVAVATISGRVVNSSVIASRRGSEAAALLADEVAGGTGVKDAEVWIEELVPDPRFKTATDASGTYVFADVPAGEYHIIVQYVDPVTGKTMKTRSAALQVNGSSALVEVADLVGEAVENVATGQLRDAEGNFLPEGTVLTLWGETFAIGKDGTFTSPALPKNASEAEILVKLPDGNTVSFTTSFSSDVVPAFVELQVGADDNGNHAPAVVVTALVNGEAVSKVSPGALVTLRAVGSDDDSGDQSALVFVWSTTSGTLADGVSASEKLWTAPDYFTVATITVEVKDPKNATGKVNLPILVGIDKPSQVNTSSEKAITSFGFSALLVSVTIDTPNRIIAVTAPVGTAVNALVANFSVSDRATVKVAGTTQVSGKTANNFSSSLIYTVTAEDTSTADWTITLNVSGAQSVQITVLDLTSLITRPVKGAAPVTAAINAAQYTSGAISWYEANGTTVVTSDFAAAKVYVARLTLTAKPGYSLAGVAADSFSYAGATSLTNAAGSGNVVITFPATADAVVDALDLTALVTAPTKGASPMATAFDEAKSATISWFEADGTTAVSGNFAGAKVYVARLTLTAKPGYSLTGVTANSFLIPAQLRLPTLPAQVPLSLLSRSPPMQSLMLLI